MEAQRSRQYYTTTHQ